MAVEKRASVSGQTIRLLQCLNRHFNLIIDVIKKRTQDEIVKKPIREVLTDCLQINSNS